MAEKHNDLYSFNRPSVLRKKIRKHKCTDGYNG